MGVRGRLAVGLGAVVLLAPAACSVAGGGSSDGACAFTVTFDGREYDGVFVQVAPVVGAALGGAQAPDCEGDAEERIPVAAIQGVSPDVAVLRRDDPNTVLVRRGTSPWPPEIEALLRAPACDPADEPISLTGSWDGILGPDETTEVDLIPPYDIEMTVQRASSARYERASLVVHVTPTLGRPISHDDVAAYLWQAGSVSVETTCDGDHFVATRVSVGPPD